MGGFDIGRSRTKWWGKDRHIVIYYTKRDSSEVYFVTSVPEPGEWITKESWSAKGDVKELRAAYADFHQDVRNVLDACPDCHKWAILEREPLPRWSDGNVVLLGDAAHPMTPYMAQGAATSIEDAAVLARCLDAVEGDDIAGAFRRYEAHRKPRTSVVQAISSRQYLDARRARRRHLLALRLRRLECAARSAGVASEDAGGLRGDGVAAVGIDASVAMLQFRGLPRAGAAAPAGADLQLHRRRRRGRDDLSAQHGGLRGLRSRPECPGRRCRYRSVGHRHGAEAGGAVLLLADRAAAAVPP